jgi:hypothetical protein
MLTKSDLKQIESKGITVAQVEEQLNRFNRFAGRMRVATLIS